MEHIYTDSSVNADSTFYIDASDGDVYQEEKAKTPVASLTGSANKDSLKVLLLMQKMFKGTLGKAAFPAMLLLLCATLLQAQTNQNIYAWGRNGSGR